MSHPNFPYIWCDLVFGHVGAHYGYDQSIGELSWVDVPADPKETNPKQAIGTNKVPFHLWPQTATIAGTMALLDGALKYGRSNWRVAGVRASVYYDALMRHIIRWFEGEDIDPDSGEDHLGHALASLAILVDAREAGKLVDDRMYPGGLLQHLDRETPNVQRLREKYADRNPKHYSRLDAQN